MEETFRRAKYLSAAAIPIRGPARDVGVMVFGTFEAGAYGPRMIQSLHRLAETLVPSFRALGSALVASSAPTGESVADDELAAILPAVVNEAPSGPELVRRLSGFLHAHLPHDRLELIAFANGSRAAMPLSGLSSRRRWGTGASTWGDLVKLVDEFFEGGDTATIGNLSLEAPGLAWPSAPGGSPAKIGSVLAARLSLGGEQIGLLVLGHAAQDLYRVADQEVAAQVAGAVAARVAGLRLEAEVLALRGQLEVLQAPSLPVLRAADTLSGTAHLGEALHRFGADVREVIPHDRIVFLLRVSETDTVELTADSIRPISDLPLKPTASSQVRAVLEGDRPWVLAHQRDSAQLGVALRVADRVIGAMVLEGSGFPAPRDTAAVAQQFAAIVAPHLELLRRSSTGRPANVAARRG